MANNRNTKHTPPIQLHKSNVTPLATDRLEEYVTSSTETYLQLCDLRRGEKNKTTLIQAGTQAIHTTPKQPSNDIITTLGQRDKAAEELLKVVENALKIAKKSKLKIPNGKRKKADGISLKDTKKITEKAGKDYEGDTSRVVDQVRCTILADNVDDLQILSEIFRPCANPDVIRFRNEFNKINPEKGGIRRLQINVALPEADGHVAEILVFYGPSAEKYDESREAYGKQREAVDAADRSAGRGGESYKAAVIASTIADEEEKKRKKANDEAANFPEVRALNMQQTAYEIDGFPIIVNDDAREGQKFAIIPNPASGLWETDQRFLQLVTEKMNDPDYNLKTISIHEASILGDALCRNEDLKLELTAA